MPGSLQIFFDPDKIEKIFYNLLSNAFKYTPERGKIELSLFQEQDGSLEWLKIEVAARLLKQGNYNISEIAYSVGFNNPKYFSTCFSEMCHVSPKAYMK